MDLQQLDEAIKAKGLKKTYIAEVLGININTLKRKLDGENQFKVSELKMLAQELNLSEAELGSLFFNDYVAR